MMKELPDKLLMLKIIDDVEIELERDAGELWLNFGVVGEHGFVSIDYRKFEAWFQKVVIKMKGGR